MKKFFKLFLIILSLTLFSQSTFPETEGLLNKLLAPGPLMLGHKNLEGKDCLKCHDAGNGVLDSKCMECHKEIKKSFDSKKGFHGLNRATCISCHSDHKGRDLDSLVINQKDFDHKKMTGYSLDGKHSDLKCSECHTQKRSDRVIRKNDIRYFGQATACVTCHKKDDVHFFKGDFAKKDCNACHSLTSWKDQIRFNHDTETKFKLVGHHAKMKCNECHQVNKKQPKLMKYTWPKLQKNQCLACHENFHGKNLSRKYSGGDCTTCHTQSEWTIKKFDHSKTGFSLNGKHDEIKCIDCHKVKFKISAKPVKLNLNYTGLKKDCLSCHTDFHKFGSFKSAKMGNLNQCLKCHNEKDWNQIHNFEHKINTGFPLDGEHKDLKCTSCHLPSPLKPNNIKTGLIQIKLPTYHWNQLPLKTCETCHASPHVGVFSKKLLEQKCISCHTTQGWSVLKSDAGFDHNKTRFPLTGSHQSTKCSDCHGLGKNQVFKFKSDKQNFCIDCHSNIHNKQFSQIYSAQSCTSCHSTKTFKERLIFDHSKTNYPLVGKHIEVQCIDCHKPTQTFNRLTWPNFKSSNHSEVKSIQLSQFLFPHLQPKNCTSCHDDYHKGQLSKNCTDCHSEKGWRPISFEHNKQSQFKLNGAHTTTACKLCHLPTKEITTYKNQKRYIINFKPIKSECIDCHTDYHKGQLSNKCLNCHTEQAWKPQNFIHNKQSQFILRGAHEKIDCKECHKPTLSTVVFKNKQVNVIKFKPIKSTCLDCHNDYHKGSFGSKCSECHTEKTWKTTKDFHKNFTLSGVHYTLSCTECHINSRKLSGLSQQCISCHQKDDIHNGLLPNCKECHTQHFWEASKFRHSVTRFPLRGAHRTLDCAECHTNGLYKGLSTTCVSCHLQVFLANPGPHGAASTNCLECHKNTFTFKGSN